MNLINAKYKLNNDEINFLVAVIKNDIISLDAKRYGLKFIKKIISKVLEISTSDGYLFLNWFSKVKYNTDGLIDGIKLQTDVEVFLKGLSTELANEDLKYFFSLSNNYSRAIYKLLKVHQHKSYAKINLEELKIRLQIPKGLNLYSNFKIKVLNVAQQEIKEKTDIFFSIEEKKDAKKVTSLIFNIYSNVVNEKQKSIVLKTKKTLFSEIVQERKNPIVKELQKSVSEEKNAEIKRIVSIFDQERKKIQPNYSRKEYKNIDGEYLLRLHMKETNRTPAMFFDAIRWLFSKNPQASFHRQYIMNIGKLIEHFNTLEHQAMYSQEAVKFNQEAQSWYNIYKKQGLEETEILEKLREGDYIK